MNRTIAAGLLLATLSQGANSALLGTELSLETIFQSTPSSSAETLGFLTTATVVDPGVEFPSVAALEVDNPPLGLRLVDVSIDAGDDSIEIDFDNATGFSGFASGFQNTYVFSFDSSIPAIITDAAIDTSVTTLGLAASDVTFTGNQLLVNVESLPFDTSTFARINLTSVGGPGGGSVPLPATLLLLGIGLVSLFASRLKA